MTEQPMTLTAELPLVARFDQLEFQLPEDGRLSARLDAELALARLAALAGLDDQTLTGTLSADLAASGTVGAPRARGRARGRGRRLCQRLHRHGARGSDPQRAGDRGSARARAVLGHRRRQGRAARQRRDRARSGGRLPAQPPPRAGAGAPGAARRHRRHAQRRARSGRERRRDVARRQAHRRARRGSDPGPGRPERRGDPGRGDRGRRSRRAPADAAAGSRSP